MSQSDKPKRVITIGQRGAIQVNFITIEQIREDEWYKTRPTIIQEAIEKMPPVCYYRFKDSGKQCFIIGYTEPENDNDEVTLTVQKTGKGGAMAVMGLSSLDQNKVFGVKVADLEIWEDEVESKK